MPARAVSICEISRHGGFDRACLGTRSARCQVWACLVRWVLCLSVLAAPAASAVAAQESAPLQELEEQAFKQAAALVAPAVVRVQTVGGRDLVEDTLTGRGPTTGVVVAPEGLIISSAYNFAAEPSSILVTLADSRRLPARIVATDHLRMLTLLKVDAEGLVPIQPADPATLRVGQWAIAIGRTYDAEFPSVSVGIVSALDRFWGKAVQTDAKISPANYGGPLLDITGRTIGVLVPLSPEQDDETAGVEWYDSGIGFAIPAQDVLQVAERLKSGDDLWPGKLGMTIKSPNLYSGEAVVDRVRYGSPAEEAGLKPGDVITQVDALEIRTSADIKRALATRYAGERMALKYRRGDESLETEATLIKELIPYQVPYLGILPARLASSVPETPGVEIRHVFEGSPAADAKLRSGDRITKLGDTDVANAAELLDQLSRLLPDTQVKLTISRGDEARTIDVTLGEMPKEVPTDVPSAAIPRPAVPAAQQGAEPAEKAATEPDKTEPEAAKQPDPEKPVTGRSTHQVPGSDRSFWLYVPEDYNADYRYTLMVWLHPAGNTLEAEVLERWKSICDQRGIILLGPEAGREGWTLNDAELVGESVKLVRQRYSIDLQRIVAHGFDDGGRFAIHLAFKERELYRGVLAAAASLREPPPENRPEYRLQLHFISGEKDRGHPLVVRSVELLRELEYPCSFRDSKELAHEYPTAELIEEAGRFVDLLDRI